MKGASDEAVADAPPSDRAVTPATRALSRALRLELVCFALVALLPLVPYLTLLLVEGVPRYSVYADLALMEHEIRHVWSGETLLGLGSRFRWHHPGPALFYLCAPFQALWSPTSTGMYVGTWFIAALAAVAPVVAVRLQATRAHAIGVLAVYLAWFAAFGNLAVNPWVRTVVVLPFLSYVVLMAVFARGGTGALLPAALLGLVVTHTHVASVSTVGAIGGIAVVSFVVSKRRGGRITRRDWTWIAVTAGVVALFFVPVVVEQLRAPPRAGNISKLLRFASGRNEPLRPWGEAFKNWALATSWLPDRLLSATLLEEGLLPEVMRWEPVPLGISKTARAILGVEVVAVLASAIVALRRRDAASLTLLAFGVVGSAFAVSSMRAILGEQHYSLIFWTIVPGTVAWMGVFTTFASALAPKIERWRAESPHVLRALVGLGLLAALTSAGFNRQWLGRNPRAPGSSPEMAPVLEAILGTIHERLAKEDAVPVIHMMGGWTWATAAELELEKDGIDVRIADVDTWSYAGAKTAAGAPRAIHLYFEIPADPLPIAPCLELLAQHGAVKAYASAVDVTACDAPRAD